MKFIDEAVTWLEKANADLDPELLDAPAAREMLEAYVRAQRLAAFGVTALTRKLDDASEIARVTGTSMGKAKATIETGKALGDADQVRAAFKSGELSM
ncbi:MAG: hypothetical protein ACRDM0_24420, partial [Thermoleophilaceae bacterium]